MSNTISILIITYNRPNDLLEFLHSLKVQNNAISIIKEVLILNNASTVSYKQVEEFIVEHSWLKINFIDSSDNLGVSRGRNQLMAIAQGEWLLVIDDDVLFTTPDDLQKIARIPNKDFFTNMNTVAFTLRVIYHSTHTVQRTAFPHKKYAKYKDKQQFLTSYYVGCAHLMKRSILDRTGLYPNSFFYGMEEYDLSYRILNTGATIGYDGEVTLEHKESPIGRSTNEEVLKMSWINKSKVAYKYLPILYFLSTSFSWSFKYLKNTNWKWMHYFNIWKEILKIPFSEERQPISRKTLQYLRKVEARLWY